MHQVVTDALEKCLEQGVDVSGLFEFEMEEMLFAEELYTIMCERHTSQERWELFKLLRGML
jgi:hypothetical protein